MIARIEELGLFALVYTSFNHGKRGLQLTRDDVLRKLGIKSDPTLEQVKEYLHLHGKDRYEAEFIDAVKITAQKKQVKKGVVIELETPPLDKFRLIFPLAEPVELIDLAETQSGALEVWGHTITGLAVNTLGVHFDTSCTDPSRLFYTPRHPKNAEHWDSVIIQGKPLRFEDIKPYKKSLYTKERDANPFVLAGGDNGERGPQCLMPAGKSLNEWHSRIGKERFLIADVIEGFCADKVRVAGGEGQGKVHTECPFEHEHSEEGGTACMAVNCLDNENGYWTWFCHHDSCQDRHKLEFLEQALRDGWFHEDVLYDEDYVLPADDEDETAEEMREAHQQGPLTKESLGTKEAVKASLATAGIDEDSSDSDIRIFLRRALDARIDLTGRARVVDALAHLTNLTKPDLKAIWKELDDEAASEKAAKRRVEAEREHARRQSLERPGYVPLEDATLETVHAAARDASWLPTNYHFDDGWFYVTNFEDPAKSMRVCRAFEVVGISYHEGGKNIEVTIRFLHRSDKSIGITETTFPLADTYRDATVLVSKLVGDGLVINPRGGVSGGAEDSAVGALLFLLRSIETDHEALIRTKSGWLSDKTAYVAPTGEVIKADEDVHEYILDPKMRVSASRAGSQEEWTEAVNTACLGTNGEYTLVGTLSGFWSAPLGLDRLSDFRLTGAGLSEEESRCPDTAATASSSSAWSSPSIMPARACMRWRATTISPAT